MYVYTYVHISTYPYTYTHINLPRQTLGVHGCIYVHLYIYLHIHTHIRIYSHISRQTLGVHLHACGMQYWDLGMSMDYKISMGAYEVARQRFLIILRTGTVYDIV